MAGDNSLQENMDTLSNTFGKLDNLFNKELQKRNEAVELAAKTLNMSVEEYQKYLLKEHNNNAKKIAEKIVSDTCEAVDWSEGVEMIKNYMKIRNKILVQHSLDEEPDPKLEDEKIKIESVCQSHGINANKLSMEFDTEYHKNYQPQFRPEMYPDSIF